VNGREMISASARLIGVLAPGESLTASEATDGLATLNRMLGGMSNDGLVIHAITEETPLTLTSGDGSYTLGASGDITTRPMSIEEATLRNGSIDTELKAMTSTEYAAITDKTIQGVPERYYDDGGYTQRTIKLYPVPNSSSYKLCLWTKRALTEISTLDTSVSLPPGYEEMLVYNLAVRLSPEYGRPVPAEVAAIAMESKANIKSQNHRSMLLRCDEGLTGSGGFNFDTGGG
jgi:hypothetical protein